MNVLFESVWIITAWQCISPQVIMKGFKKCCISIALMISCGMPVNRMGMLGESVRKMKALTVKLETVTLSGKGRWNQT
jgi:hypothetical protein